MTSMNEVTLSPAALKHMFSTPESIRERSDAYRRQMQSTNPGYTMNNRTWPGLSKAVEETSEFITVAAKIQAVFGQNTYYNGENLRRHLTEEVADVLASMTFLIQENRLDSEAINRRVVEKLKKYDEWKLTNQ